MRNKLWYLTRISLNKKIKTKWFLAANIILAIVIIGLLNIDTIIKSFGGDFNNDVEILVVDDTNNFDSINNLFIEYSKNLINNTKLINYNKGYDEAIKEIKDSDNLILVVNYDYDNYIKANIVGDSYIDNTTIQVMSYVLNDVRSNMVLDRYNLSDGVLNDLNGNIVLTKTILKEDKTNNTDMDLIMNVIFPIIILPFFMLTMFLVQMIGSEINEEKATKSMEIIISNVSSKTHFFSKLIAGNVFVLSQGLLLVFYMIIGVIIRYIVGGGMFVDTNTSSFVTYMATNIESTGIMEKLSYIIPVSLVLMIITFFAYSLVAAILASMTTNMEDFQQLQTPIIVVSLLGYYLAIMASMFNGSIFIKIVSYIPFLSALLVPSLLALGQIGIIDVIISFVLLLFTIYLLFKYGLRIYKQGILNYSGNNLWKKMFKAIKEK